MLLRNPESLLRCIFNGWHIKTYAKQKIYLLIAASEITLTEQVVKKNKKKSETSE